MLEKKGILGETSRRPGDVTIPLWCEGKGLAIDVAVTCPFSASNMARDNPAEYYAEKLKHRKYDAGFVGINFDFVFWWDRKRPRANSRIPNAV